MNYGKPAANLPDLVQKLESRGLLVPDPQVALRTLEHIGYYRLTAYSYPFQRIGDPGKPFHPGITFDRIVDLYTFDRKLRLLVMDAIERIEVATRSCITTEMSLAHGPHWYLDPVHFNTNPVSPGAQRLVFDHQGFIGKLTRDLGLNRNPRRPHSEVFIDHYFNKYTSPQLPPSWMIAEVITMGTISRIYEGLADRSRKKKIAKRMGLGWQQLESWLHALTYTRNVCAHHSRLWNRSFSIQPAFGSRTPPVPNPLRFYSVAVVTWEMLQLIDPDTHWNGHLADLIEAHPQVDLTAMGFPPNWKNEPFWKLEQHDHWWNRLLREIATRCRGLKR